VVVVVVVVLVDRKNEKKRERRKRNDRVGGAKVNRVRVWLFIAVEGASIGPSSGAVVATTTHGGYVESLDRDL